MKRLLVPAALAAASALVLAGCSSSIDVADLETQVQDGLAQQEGGTWTVQCPDSMEVQAGLTADCLATRDDGQTLEITITQDDDQGNITWKAVPKLDSVKLEQTIAADITAQVGGEWTVTCEADVPLAQGTTSTCEATSTDGQSATINVTQTDDQGNVEWATAE